MQDLRQISGFRTVILELNCLAIDFENAENRGPVSHVNSFEKDWHLDSTIHLETVKFIETQRDELRTYLEVTLGKGPVL